ncbi:biotin--[acetyl-CoA-carboxylase] ligase [Dokdonella sp. MW10]|uniref:biotin--[acetyl-CoA-carboxylase] ligase n=1 Tax=Dokdonella sp. MW10 TaxID=2992926 RepID=UPI003F7D84BA
MSVQPQALLAALAASPEGVAGSALATRFGVSRAAIWKHVEALRALGAPIDARAGRGYRLLAPLDLLDVAAIRDALPRAHAERLVDLEVHWQIASTNSALLASAADMRAPLAACLAEVQSGGRGRHGRAWFTPLGGGIALSLRRRFEAGMATLGGLSLATGVAVVDALADLGADGVGLKWPNDLVAGGRKLGGILIELGGDALGPCHAVIGLGLNVRLPGDVAAGIGQPVTDLAALGVTPTRNALAAAVLARLVAALDTFEARGFEAFAEAFARHDVLRGRRVAVTRGAQVREGDAVGVDERGILRVRDAEGEFRVDSGEVSVRLAPGRAS